MPNPLASPQSSDREALRDLDNHPGWLLVLTRLQAMLQDDYDILAADQKTESSAMRTRKILVLREQMITELEAELRNFEGKEDRAHQKADEAFGYPGDNWTLGNL